MVLVHRDAVAVERQNSYPLYPLGSGESSRSFNLPPDVVRGLTLRAGELGVERGGNVFEHIHTVPCRTTERRSAFRRVRYVPRCSPRRAARLSRWLSATSG